MNGGTISFCCGVAAVSFYTGAIVAGVAVLVGVAALVFATRK